MDILITVFGVALALGFVAVLVNNRRLRLQVADQHRTIVGTRRLLADISDACENRILLAELQEHLESGNNISPSELVSAIRTLDEAIEQAMTLDQLQSGNLDTKPGWVVVDRLTNGFIDSLKVEANRKQIDFEVKCSEECPDLVKIDERLVVQAAQYVVKTAFTNTLYGGVRVSFLWEAANKGDGRGVFTIEVMDTGVGMTPQELDIAQASVEEISMVPADQRDIGAGFGITKAILGELGGTMKVESALGEGTRVTMSLPADCKAEQRAQPRRANYSNSIQWDLVRNSSVLMVLDNVESAEGVAALLGDKVKSTSVIEGLENTQALADQYENYDFDIILFQMSLGVHDIALFMEKNELKVPWMLIAPPSQRQNESNFRHAKCSGVVYTPLQEKGVLMAISSALSKHK